MIFGWKTGRLSDRHRKKSQIEGGRKKKGETLKEQVAPKKQYAPKEQETPKRGPNKNLISN